jgi:hypothetical protein
MKKFKYFVETTFNHPLAKHWGNLGSAFITIFFVCGFMTFVNLIGSIFLEINPNSIVSVVCSAKNFSVFLFWTIFSYVSMLICYTCAHFIDKE